TQECTTVGATGTCDVVIESSTPGENEIQAETTKLKEIGRASCRKSGDKLVGDAPNAHKTIGDANIQLTPEKATNEVGANHTLHCHINVNPGTGEVPAPAGTVCKVTVISGAATPTTQECTTVGATGTCDVVIESSTPGENEIQAETTKLK